MRILTVRQPWASAIIHGNERVPAKDVENRAQNIAGEYRGPVAIHAALTFDEAAYRVTSGPLSDWFDWVGDPLMTMNLGHIVGLVDLMDSHLSGMECSRGESCHEYSLCSPWAEAYHHHLVLANPRPLTEPIPYKGALGLRRFNETVDAAILRQLEALS